MSTALWLRRRGSAAGAPVERGTQTEASGPWGAAPVIEMRLLTKTYGHGDAAVHALSGPVDPVSGEALGVDLAAGRAARGRTHRKPRQPQHEEVLGIIDRLNTSGRTVVRRGSDVTVGSHPTPTVSERPLAS
jgi:hypothetical protein